MSGSPDAPTQKALEALNRANITRARLDALRVLFECEVARVSNETVGCMIYWQSARWLVEKGFAAEEDPHFKHVRLSQAGLDFCWDVLGWR